MTAQEKDTNIGDSLSQLFSGKIQDKEDIFRRAHEFQRDGYTKFSIGELLSEDLMSKLQEEVRSLTYGYATRRDLKIETTGNSPRYFRTVPQKKIESNGYMVPTLYNSPELRKYLGEIALNGLKSCIKDEEFIISKLEKQGDTHGWHWGDYPYTMIWIIDAPSIEIGGLLQCIPHTTWNKNEPRINEYIINNTIKSYFHRPGEVYFLKSDTTLHRVTPMQEDGHTRIILNTCWASEHDNRGNFEHETLNAAFL